MYRVDYKSLVILSLSALFLCCHQAYSATGATTNSPDMQEYLFAQGKRLYESGRPDQAVNVWKNIPRDSFYDPVVSMLSAKCYSKLGRHDQAEKELKEFLSRHNDSPYRDAARRALFDALHSQGKAEALELVPAVSRGAKEKDRLALILRAAELQRRLGRYSAAAENYSKLFLNYPASLEGLAASQELASLVLQGKIRRPDFSETELLERAKRLFDKGRFDLAGQTYSDLLKKQPNNVRLALKYAECLYRQRRNENAITVLKKTLEGRLPEKHRLEALYLLTLLYWRVDGGKDFQSCCDALIQSKSDKFRNKVLFNLGAYNLELGRLDAAEKHFAEALKTSPNRSTTASIKWKIAWIKYRQKKCAEAAKYFQEAGAGSTAGALSNPARYWAARSLIQSGKPDEAETLLKDLVQTSPLDYYGRQAARLLEARGYSVSKQFRVSRSFPNVKLSQAQMSNKLVATALKLMEKGMPEFAFLNLESLPNGMKSHPAVALLRAEAAHKAGKYNEAYNMLKESFGEQIQNPPDDAPRDFIEIAYPRVHPSHTVKIAEKYAIDPNLVWAVIRQESIYDPDAVSPAGALGLMQVTPAATGRVPKSGQVPPKLVADILEPENNLGLGIKILASNLRKFNGDLVPAIASYNADVRKVRQWVQRNGRMKQDEFIENIPYLETRLYVKKVLAGYLTYRELHQMKDLASRW